MPVPWLQLQLFEAAMQLFEREGCPAGALAFSRAALQHLARQEGGRGGGGGEGGHPMACDGEPGASLFQQQVGSKGTGFQVWNRRKTAALTYLTSPRPAPFAASHAQLPPLPPKLLHHPLPGLSSFLFCFVLENPSFCVAPACLFCVLFAFEKPVKL